MSWFSNAKDSVVEFLTGSSYNSEMDKASEALDKAKNVKNKSTAELQQEGREAASQAASDKAGQAKKQAKATTMQNGGNRLQAATNAASAAANAGSEGYDTTANTMTNVAQQQDTQEKNAERQALLAEAQQHQSAADTKNSNTQNMFNMGAKLLGSYIASSDSGKKKVKHTYIPAEKRVNKPTGAKNE